MVRTNRRVKGKALAFFFSIAFVIFALFLSLWINTSNVQYFSNFREEQQDYEYIGKTKEELDVITKDLIRYIQLGDEGRIEKHFNEREVLHMKDVRFLYVLTIPLMFIALIVIFLTAYWGNKIESHFYRWVAIFTLILIVLFAVGGFLMSAQFNEAFIRFHELLFTNDLWLLNPETDMMIRMLPQKIFFEIFVRILVLFGVFTALLLIACIFLDQRRRYETQYND